MRPSEIVTSRGHEAAPSLQPGAASPTTLVLDTNAVLDWLVFGDASMRAVADALARGLLRWRVTPRMLDELRAVLSRPLPQRWERARELALTIDLAQLAMVCPEPVIGRRLICRDPTDQMFIDLACEHRPGLLLTRDRALLALRRRARAVGVQIQTAVIWLASQRSQAAERSGSG